MSLINVPSIGLSKGSSGDEVLRIQNYLMQYGYIQPPQESIVKAKIDKKKAIEPPTKGEFDEKMEMAVKLFQQTNQLPSTGDLNKETLHLMMQPRCGVPDIIEGSAELEEFNLFGTQWDKTDLTYTFQNLTSDSDEAQIKQALSKAFDAWSAVSPLTFREVEDDGDFKIRWGMGEHGDNSPFDGPSQTLAHCFFPKTGMDGQLCFDDAEFWTADLHGSPGQFSIILTGIHEIGHGLGIKHSQFKDSIMYPYYNNAIDTLRPDDISAIQAIYGTN
jgi:hypothetical protein